MKIRFMAIAVWAWIVHAQEIFLGAPGVERAVGDEDYGIFLVSCVLEEQRGWAASITAIAASSLDAQPSSVFTYTRAI